jgi:hypothetical protein
MLLVALVGGFVVRVNLVDDGIFWPDEIYQSFEPAHRLVFGYGLVAWEFLEGARNWALPGVVAGILKLCLLLGRSAPEQYIPAVKLVFIVLSLLTVLGTYRLVRVALRHDGEDAAHLEFLAAAAAFIASLIVPTLYFAPRAMSENASAPAIVWGLAFLLDGRARRRDVVIGASLLGAAVLLRLQSAIFPAGALVVLAARRDGGALKVASMVLGIWALIFGGLDALTWSTAPMVQWGGWFHSAVVYLRFNLIEGKSSGFGTAPFPFYFRALFRCMPTLSIVLGVGCVAALRRAPGLTLTTAGFVLIHSFIPHKEFRFIVPALALIVASFTIGLSELPARLAKASAVLGLVLASLSALEAPKLTFGQMMHYLERPHSSAWDDFGHVNRLLMKAGKQPDLCGLRIDVAHLAWIGGSTYLHRNVPIYSGNHPVESRHFNYVLTRPGPGELIAEERGVALVRVPGIQCVQDPSFDWRLP